MARKRKTAEAEELIDPQHGAADESGDGSGEGSLEGSGANPTSEAGSAEPAAVERLRAELEEWRDRCYREAAERENMRRRARMEAEDARRFANERLVTGLLPVLDNFDRALEAAESSGDVQVLIDGVRQIQRQLQDLLQQEGVERMAALGERFDPNLHEAIMQVEPEAGQQPQQVVEELRPGYKLNERVVRPALVKVTSG